MLLAIVSLSAAPQSRVEAYKKLVYDRIGARWYWAIQPHADQIELGTVRILLVVGPKGLISAKVLSNTSNRDFAGITLDAIKKAEIPPAPSDALKNGKIEFEISFTMYPN
jgi:outer membrane biosynthesis protein TonB